MSLLRIRVSATAALLLAAFALMTVGAQSHSHDPLGVAGTHPELPSFSAGHARPERALHIEGATHLESSPCVGCLLRQRQRAVAALDRSPGAAKPDRVTILSGSAPRLPRGAYHLPAGRAPPLT